MCGLWGLLAAGQSSTMTVSRVGDGHMILVVLSSLPCRERMLVNL